jgi:hypothetical protein
LGLLLRRAECSAGPACAQAHQDGCPDEQDPEVEVRGQPQSDESQSALAASDAWADVRPDAVADAALLLREQPQDGDAGKSVDLAPDGPAPDAALQQERLPALQAMLVAAAELYKQDAAQSAERSCAEQGAEAQSVPEVQLGGARTLAAEAALKL